MYIINDGLDNGWGQPKEEKNIFIGIDDCLQRNKRKKMFLHSGHVIEMAGDSCYCNDD